MACQGSCVPHAVGGDSLCILHSFLHTSVNAPGQGVGRTAHQVIHHSNALREC